MKLKNYKDEDYIMQSKSDRIEISLYEPPPVISGVIEGNIGITDDDLKKFESSRILIADANKIDSSILSSIFNRMGAISKVVKTETDTIKEVVEYGNYYDLLFIDQYIPENGIIDLAESIRYDSRFDSMPLIGMSHLGEDEPGTLIRNGINGLIRKPLMSGSIYSVLEIFIGEKAFLILSIEEGISHTNGNKELYKMILEDFREHYHEVDRTIIQYIYREEYIKLGETIVDIEGLGGTMGAILFHELTKEMLKKYRKEDYQGIAFLIPRFKNELYKLLDKIDRYIDK